ncbi:MAG: hypothetical protein ACJ766_05020, partial [Thermoleophilaceae bacterium]
MAVATPALALEGGEGSPLGRAIDDSGVAPPAPQRFSLPDGKLKVTPDSLLAARPGQKLHFAVRLSRTVPGATLTLRLPRRW